MKSLWKAYHSLWRVQKKLDRFGKSKSVSRGYPQRIPRVTKKWVKVKQRSNNEYDFFCFSLVPWRSCPTKGPRPKTQSNNQNTRKTRNHQKPPQNNPQNTKNGAAAGRAGGGCGREPRFSVSRIVLNHFGIVLSHFWMFLRIFWWLLVKLVLSLLDCVFGLGPLVGQAGLGDRNKLWIWSQPL